jgi:hypothetical protein
VTSVSGVFRDVRSVEQDSIPEVILGQERYYAVVIGFCVLTVNEATKEGSKFDVY